MFMYDSCRLKCTGAPLALLFELHGRYAGPTPCRPSAVVGDPLVGQQLWEVAARAVLALVLVLYSSGA